MDPQSVTLLALVVLAAAGITVAVTGFIHLRRDASSRSNGSNPSVTGPVADEPSAEGS